MAITSGFFDSSDGDRTYTAEQMSSYFDGIVSDGVFETVGGRMAVTAALSGLAVQVDTGRALIQSHWVKNDALATVSLSAADIQYPRMDAIVLRLDASNRQITLTSKSGTPSANPQLPAITRSDTVYELYLASVYVPKNATAPGQITDLRPSGYCGWVTGVVQQVDTSDLFEQWDAAYARQYAEFAAYIAQKQAAFDQWFGTLTGQLIVETGLTKYQARISATAGSTAAVINVPEFVKGVDVLLVFFDGLAQIEDIDYEIITLRTPHILGDYAINLKPSGRTFGKATQVSYIVLKNEIGKNVAMVENATLTVTPVYASEVASAGDFEGEA